MTTWEIIKEHFVGGSRPGSIGYIRDVRNAADLFIRIMGQLKDETESKEAFNKDSDVRESIWMS